jgi:hypothetical protein
VICLDALVLPLDERSYVSRQALLERCFISSLEDQTTLKVPGCIIASTGASALEPMRWKRV